MMPTAREHRRPIADAPRDRSDLRAASGLLNREIVAHKQQSARLRVARLGNTVVGVCHLGSETLRIGESRLRMAHISDLKAHESFDPQPIRAVLIDDALSKLEESRCPLVVAKGDEFTFRRFGFLPLPGEARTTHVNSSSVAHHDIPSWRTAKPGDISALRQVYSAHTRGLDAAVVRDAGYFAQRWQRYANTILVTGRRGAPPAYATVEVTNQVIHVLEACWRDESARGRLQDALHAYADTVERATLIAPKSLFPKAESIPQTETRLFARLVHHEDFLQAMLPEWERRLAISGTVDTASLAFDLTSGLFRLRARDGSLALDDCSGPHRIRVTRSELLELALGTRDAESVLGARYRIQASPTRALIDTLFPKRDVVLSGISLM